MKIIPYLLLSALLLYSCHSRQYSKEIIHPSPYFLDLMQGNDKSVFHGLNFNLLQDDVRKIEKSKLYERTADHLFYTHAFPKDSTAFDEYSDIEYFFDKEGKLEIITATVYLNDSTQQAQVLQNFHQYFNNRYGDPKKDEYGYDVWRGTMEASDDDYDYSIGLTIAQGDIGVVLEYLRD